MTPEQGKDGYGVRAWRYACQLAFPRLTGRADERKAAGMVIRAFASLGYKTVCLPFAVAGTPWAWMRAGWIAAFVWLAVAGLAAERHPLIAAGCCFSWFGGVFLMERLWRRRALREMPPEAGIASSNIVARRPVPSETANHILHFIAHYDSKSQTVALPWRVALITLLAGGTLVFGTVNLIAGFAPALLATTGGTAVSAFAFVLWLASLLTALALLGVRTENRSPGALDNAGSVGVLLALAEALRDRALKHVEPVFVSTGAEEMGLSGAYALVRQWRCTLDRDRSFFLNLDLVGVPGSLRLIEGARMLQRPRSAFARLIRRAARRLAVPLSGFLMLPGFLVDHIPWSRAGFPAVSLIGVSGRAGRVHTPDDTMDLVDPAGLDEAVRLLMGVVEEMEQAAS